MSEGIIYMLIGGKHAVQLAVSVFSLRMHSPLPIALIAGDPIGFHYCKLIADATEDCTVIRWHGSMGKPRGTQYLNKCRMQALSPFDRTVFLDADTLVASSEIAALFPTTACETVLTAFAGWKSNGRRIGKRIKEWAHVLPDAVDEQLSQAYPAINTGVIGFTRESLLMKDWHAVTSQNIRFICDEIAAQLMQAYYPVRVKDDRYNHSPIYPTKAASEVVIWHGHGFKFVRREAGRAVWLPWFNAVRNTNFADVRSWMPALDKSLAKFLAGEAKARNLNDERQDTTSSNA